MDKVTAVILRKYLVLTAVAVAAYIGFKFLSPFISPFLFAFAFIAITHPLLERAQKRFHIKKGFLAAGILLLICITAGAAIWGLFVLICQKAGELFGQMDLLEQKLCLFVNGCCDGLEKRFGMDGDGVETYILERMNVFIENFQVQVVPKIMNRSLGYVKNVAGIVSFLVIMFIAAVLLAKDYTEIVMKIRGQEELTCVLEIGKKVFHHVGTFLKAQLIILLLISLICASVLTIGGIEGGFFIGMFAGFMDMLPFIGTGIVLMPLAFWQILNGYYTKAAVCIVLYVICAVTREFLEPKLIGERMGIFPVCILFSVYAGVKAFGVFGILKGPLLLITVYEVYKYLRKSDMETT